MSSPLHRYPLPWWMKVLIIAGVLPLLLYPGWFGKEMPDTVQQTLLWAYPLFVVGSAWCAWAAYPQRRLLSWILVTLLYLSNAGAIYLFSYALI